MDPEAVGSALPWLIPLGILAYLVAGWFSVLICHAYDVKLNGHDIYGNDYAHPVLESDGHRFVFLAWPLLWFVLGITNGANIVKATLEWIASSPIKVVDRYRAKRKPVPPQNTKSPI